MFGWFEGVGSGDLLPIILIWLVVSEILINGCFVSQRCINRCVIYYDFKLVGFIFMTYLTVFIVTELRASNKSVISAKLPTQSLIGHIEPFHLKQTDVLFKLHLSYFITNVYSSACPKKLIDMIFDTKVIRFYFVYHRLNTNKLKRGWPIGEIFFLFQVWSELEELE